MMSVLLNSLRFVLQLRIWSVFGEWSMSAWGKNLSSAVVGWHVRYIFVDLVLLVGCVVWFFHIFAGFLSRSPVDCSV